MLGCVKYLFVLLLFPLICSSHQFDQPTMREVPVAYKGRIRALDAYARLWLYDYYHAEKLSQEHLEGFSPNHNAAIELMWQMHFLGHERWKDAPLFHLSSFNVKNWLSLPLDTHYFSFNQLYQAIYLDEKSSIQAIKNVLSYYFWKQYHSPSNRSKSEKQELKQLATGLWLKLEESQIVLLDRPEKMPWSNFKRGSIIHANAPKINLRKEKANAEALVNLMQKLQEFVLIGAPLPGDQNLEREISLLKQEGRKPREIAERLEAKYPLFKRLKEADSMLVLLPSKQGKGIWLPLKALKTRVYDPESDQLIFVDNFTLYLPDQFAELRAIYLDLEKATLQGNIEKITALSQLLADRLNLNYQKVAKTLALEASGKVLTYPSQGQLAAEVFYYRFPIIPITLIFYVSALAVLISSYFVKRKWRRWGVHLFTAAFALHTALLFLRSYILNRPPVSNMFETVVYVPWIAVLASLYFYYHFKQRFPIFLIASGSVAAILLLLVRVAGLHHGLEVVQAVLDSQYWLIVHVLLVVGSYGVFALASFIAHIYLIWNRKRTEGIVNRFLGKSILNIIYIAVAMLIPGTILGGVWAAESWGRFWDWDPKESWAFISICTYLIWIHAYRYGYINLFGIAIGAILGFLTISFTWYGVNYILGTGLHSYGFGTGGESYYYGFILFELLFTGYFLIEKRLSRAPLKQEKINNLLDK